MDDKRRNYWAYITGILIIILGGIIYFLLRSINDLKKEINSLQGKNFTQIGDGTVKPISSEGTPKTIEQEIKDKGLPAKDIKNDADKNGSAITGVTTIVVKTEPQSGNNGSSSRSEPTVIIREVPKDCKCPYINSTEYKTFYEKFGAEYIPFGEIGFTASASPNPWSHRIFPRKYSVTTVIAEDENHKKTAYSSFQLQVEGETHKLPISEATMIYSEPPSVLRWNPRLFMGMNAGPSFPILSENPANVSLSWGPSLGITMASLGKYKSSPDWYFGEFCVGYDIMSENAFFAGFPFLYRISNHIPFTESLYLGPGIGMDIQGSLSILAGLKLGL